MTIKHTAGPWTVSPNAPTKTRGIDILSYNASHIVASVYYPQSIGDWNKDQQEKARVNARLISAAPDLLEALKAVVAISDRKHDAWDAARAAIAKATGESQ